MLEFFITMFILFLILQYGGSLILLICKEFVSRKDFYQCLIPYPYWLVVGLIYLIKDAIKTFRELPKE